MPYSPEHKVKTRSRIIECARRMFIQKGYSEVSIDEIMAEAGLTRGGFYNHFKNKEELFAEAIAASMSCENDGERGSELFSSGLPASELARKLVDIYLSKDHLQDEERMCPLVALPSDVARAGPVIKASYQKLFEGMVSIFTESITPTQDQDPGERALALAATCVGGMVLARSVDDPDLSDRIRDAALVAAHDILDTGAAAPGLPPANGQHEPAQPLFDDAGELSA